MNKQCVSLDSDNLNSHSGNLNTDSEKIQKSVQLETRMSVQVKSELVFRLEQNECSSWARICNMVKKIILILPVILLLGSVPVTGFSATSRMLSFTNGISFANQLNGLQSFAVKNESAYSEAKDPFLRKGTQNSEESQVSFFVIPAIVAGLSVIFLFFKRK